MFLTYIYNVSRVHLFPIEKKLFVHAAKKKEIHQNITKVQSTDTTLKRLSSKTIFTCNSMLISKHYKLTGKLEREN